MKPNTVISACPEWSHLISQKYKAYRQARKAQVETGLQQILAAEAEPPLSVREAATRLGETTHYLYKHFPGLCRQITQRRARYQPPPPIRPRLKDHPQLRRQFAAILAAQEQPPPSLREVARRLGCGSTTLRHGHADLCAQLRQQTAAHHQAQIAGLPARLAEILATNETPAPSLRAVAARLGVTAHLLRQTCPVSSAEILRRAQAERQAAKQQRRLFLAQVLAEPEETSPALTRVAKILNASDASLQEQFPAESALIVQRSQAYKTAEKQAWQEALQAALTADPGASSLIQVARQLGHPNSQKLRFHFPELCRQLLQRQQADLANHHQTIQVQLEAILAEGRVPAPTLTEVARRLEYNEATLKRHFPAQVQTLLERRRHDQNAQKLAAERTLQAVLAGDQAPPVSMKALAQELGYTYDTLRAYFPDLTAAVQARRQAFIKAKSQERCQELIEKVRRLTQELHQQGLDPTLRQVALRLSSPKLTIDPQVRQAWREARQEIGLPS
jgi:AraC-like DNA-binding protein